MLLWEADAFEYSFLKVARHDIRLRTEDVTGELAAFLKDGNLKSVREYAEDSRHDGVRVTVFDATGKTLVDAGKHERSASARYKEFVDTLANGEVAALGSLGHGERLERRDGREATTKSPTRAHAQNRTTRPSDVSAAR